MKAVVKTKCPFLFARHCKACLNFAHAYKNQTLDDWKSVIWSYETKINHLRSDGCKWVWKRPGEKLNDRQVEGTVKFEGGSIMIWGCMTWEEVGFATNIDGRMDSNLYLQILKNELLNSLKHYGLNPANITFRQNNNSKNTFKNVKKWLGEQEFRTMVCPEQSSDLSPLKLFEKKACKA